MLNRRFNSYALRGSLKRHIMIWDEVFWLFFIIACIFTMFMLIESFSLMTIIYSIILIMLGGGKLAGEIQSKRKGLKSSIIKVKRKILDGLKE